MTGNETFTFCFVSLPIEISLMMAFVRPTGPINPYQRAGSAPRAVTAGAIHTTRPMLRRSRLPQGGITATGTPGIACFPGNDRRPDQACQLRRQLRRASSGVKDVERLCTGPGHAAVLAQIEEADDLGPFAGLDVGDEARGRGQDEIDAEPGPARLAL